MVRLGDSDDGINALICRCGWFSIDPDPSMAWHDMRVHWRNDYRLTCPQCGWYWEDQDREDAERQMALHIAIKHPASFPWGYQAP